MLLREESEQREYKLLAAFGTKAAESKGRQYEEAKCDFRTDFQRDRDRIIHSKALRRLMHKTQVFIAPEEDHFRTRLTHTLEVAQLARTVARALRLNEDLTEAIALGHDLGHTPFGHIGETTLADVHPPGFRHNIQSLRVCDVLEKHSTRRGMNLTEEVRDGILNHTGATKPFTPEGQIVKTADRIAYVNHDTDDALRCGIIKECDLPVSAVSLLGDSTSRRINTLIRDMVEASDDTGEIMLSEGCLEAMDGLRSFLFKRVYTSDRVSADAELCEIDSLIPALYYYYLNNPEYLPGEYHELVTEYGVHEIVKDHIAGMTDRYALDTYLRIRTI